MAKILLSIYPEYTNAIFSGIKTAEFRRKVVNELLEGGSHTLYFYETKKNGGAGKVVGQADVKEVFVTLQAAYMVYSSLTAFQLKKCSSCICAGADREKRLLPDGGIATVILQLTVILSDGLETRNIITTTC